eukprot:GDKJ01018570.1.p1 GENE.GDKJ01018570.1~~GDKJ01018570.1.p1  ORF type:complete len:151 (-),score=12.66 GDKJ01018570.1:76-528(-)
MGVCGAAVWAAMKVVSGWCCGSECPTFTDPTVPVTLAGKHFTDGEVSIRFTMDNRYSITAVERAEGGEEVRPLAPPCLSQEYSLGTEKDSLFVSLDGLESCGETILSAVPAHSGNALLNGPRSVMYWPNTDVIAVGNNGGVTLLERVPNL